MCGHNSQPTNTIASIYVNKQSKDIVSDGDEAWRAQLSCVLTDTPARARRPAMTMTRRH